MNNTKDKEMLECLKYETFKNKKNGITIIKKFTNKGNSYIKRNIGELAYHTYEYIFKQNDFEAKIRFNLEIGKSFNEEEFIKTLLNLDTTITSTRELKDIIIILSYQKLIPDNEGFFEVVKIEKEKIKTK